jgi:hypothetical protein
MFRFAAFLVLLLLAGQAGATDRSVTYYLDAAIIKGEASAVKGYLELSLPAGVRPGSLRIKPLGVGRIIRVELTPTRAGHRLEQELALLGKRKEILRDRLKALDTREEIFLAAAKSQSGKAPRKSKTNPEPMTTIRQGTEFAIAQLEEVYRARRNTGRELAGVEERVAKLRSEGNIGGQVVRVLLENRTGKVAFSYLMPELNWSPTYDFRLSGETDAEVAMYAQLPTMEGRGAVAVVPFTMAEAPADADPLPVSGGLGRVNSFKLPLDKAQFHPLLLSSLVFTVRNQSKLRLPAGEAACYWQGEYIGKVRFDGALPGESRELIVGR